MNTIIGLIRELFGLFVDDGSLALAILAVVAVAAVLSGGIHLPPLVIGAVLIIGCILVLLENVLRASRQG